MDKTGRSGIGFFGIADEARFVNVFAGEAEVGGGGFAVPVWNGNVLSIVRADYLAPLLRRVVLIGQPALGLRLDVVRIGLNARGGGCCFKICIRNLEISCSTMLGPEAFSVLEKA